MKINHRAHVFLLLALALGLTSSSLWAVEDGLGTNIVRHLRVNDGGTMTLGGTAITNWTTMPVGTGAVSLVDYLATNAVFQDATNALNTDVTNVSYQVTNILYGATNALDTAVTTLNERTNAWNNAVVIKTGTGDIIASNLYYMTDGSAWAAANASTNTTAKGLIGLALVTESDPDPNPYTNGLLLNGQYTIDSHGFTVGAPIYLGIDDCTMTNALHTGTNEIVRIVGYAINDDTIMFNPDRTYIEILGE